MIDSQAHSDLELSRAEQDGPENGPEEVMSSLRSGPSTRLGTLCATGPGKSRAHGMESLQKDDKSGI